MEKLKTKTLSDEAKEAIYRYIKSRDISIDNKLPSEENMAKLLGVSRITIRSALNDLASEGIIFRRQGKGTFINKEALKMKAKLNPIRKFDETIKRSGFEPSTKDLSYEIKKADYDISNILGIKENDLIVEVKKTFYADDKPCAYCIDKFALNLLNDEKSFEDIKKYENSIFQFLRDKANINILWDRVEFDTVTNFDFKELGDIFNVNEHIKSFLVIEGVNFDENDLPVMYATEYIDTKIIKFNLIRQKN